MGRYVNPGNRNYARVVNSGIYVDKTGMLAHLNQVMDTEQCWICVSPPALREDARGGYGGRVLQPGLQLG